MEVNKNLLAIDKKNCLYHFKNYQLFKGVNWTAKKRVGEGRGGGDGNEREGGEGGVERGGDGKVEKVSYLMMVGWSYGWRGERGKEKEVGMGREGRQEGKRMGGGEGRGRRQRRGVGGRIGEGGKGKEVRMGRWQRLVG